MEGNHVYNADIGGPYQDAKSNTRDIIIRNNFYKNVGRGPYWNLGGLGLERAQTGPPVSSINRSGTVGTITNLSSFADFEAGVRVKLVASVFSGVYVIQTKTPTSFTIILPNSGATSANVTSAKKIFSLSRAVVEGNVIELTADLIQVANVRAVAVADANDSSPYSETPDYVHEQLIIRNNKIRYVDGAPPSDASATLIEMKGIRSLFVQNNVLDTIAAAPLVNHRCGSATYFNNRTPSGALEQGKNNDSGRKYDELETDAEDAFVMAMFNER